MQSSTAAHWKKFDADNGGDPVAIGDWYVYRTGAKREPAFMGRSADPPADPYERAKLVLSYWQTRLKTATAAFDAQKRDLLERAAINRRQVLYAPDGDGVERLKTMQATVRDLQAKVAEAKADVERHAPRRIAQAADRRASSDASIDRFVADVSRIEV